MLEPIRGFHRFARRTCWPRVLALPLLRALARLAAVSWVVLAPAQYWERGALVWAIAASQPGEGTTFILTFQPTRVSGRA